MNRGLKPRAKWQWQLNYGIMIPNTLLRKVGDLFRNENYASYPLIFITGFTGTGKTYLANEVKEKFGLEIFDEDKRRQYEIEHGHE